MDNKPTSWWQRWAYNWGLRGACGTYGMAGKNTYFQAQALYESAELTAPSFWHDRNPFGMVAPTKYMNGQRTINYGGVQLERAMYSTFLNGCKARCEWELRKKIGTYPSVREWVFACLDAGYVGEMGRKDPDFRELYANGVCDMYKDKLYLWEKLLDDSSFVGRVAAYWNRLLADILPAGLGEPGGIGRRIINVLVSIGACILLFKLAGGFLRYVAPSMFRTPQRHTLVKETVIKAK